MEDLNTVIERAVLSAWENKHPILLSKLGEEDNKRVGKMAKEKSGGLAKYLNDYLNNKIIVIRHSKKPAEIGAVPRNSETQNITDFDAILDGVSSSEQTKTIRLRFRPSFWAAFRKQLEPNKYRGMEAEGFNNFNDYAEQTDIPEGMLEIQREYIARDNSVSDDQVYQNIIKWAEMNNVILENFSIIGQKRLINENQLNASILDRLFCTLDPSDLKRIKMPLDIILKLSQSRL